VGDPGGPQQDRGVEDVRADDAVRREAEDEDEDEPDERARADARQADERPEDDAHADRAQAPAGVHLDGLALARGAHEGPREDPERGDRERDGDEDEQDCVAIRPTAATPASEPGTEPTASHLDTPRSTVPERRWRQPPTVFVTAP
jgi:hypothetical protein